MTTRILHLTQVTKVPLLDRAGERLGRVEDVLVRISDGGYAPVVGITAAVSGRDVFLPTELIAAVEPGRIRLARESSTCGGSSAGPARCSCARTCSGGG